MGMSLICRQVKRENAPILGGKESMGERERERERDTDRQRDRAALLDV
jgi:hypothetical protein